MKTRLAASSSTQIWVAAALLLATFARPSHAGPCEVSGLYPTSTNLTVPGSPRHVEVADLNSDGFSDLVVSSSSLFIYLAQTSNGLPTGDYVLSGSYATNTDPTGSVIADLNGDGIKDIAVACDGGGVYVFMGQGTAGHGNGLFSSGVAYATGHCWDVAAGDVNGDGILDLVTGNRDGAIVVLRGQSSAGLPTGVFGPSTTSAAAGAPKGLELADMNGDGALDIVQSSEGGTVGVLRGRKANGVPDGTFEAAVSVTATGSTYDVAVGDFNGDGNLDIATANYIGNSVSVLLGDGTLKFQAAANYGVQGSPLGIRAVDVNNDGVLDLVAAATGAFTIDVLAGQSVAGQATGTFQPAVPFGSGESGYGVAVADLNGDGAPDALVPGVSSGHVVILKSTCTAQAFSLIVNVTGSGSVTRSPDLPLYPPETVVTLTANPGTGAQFTSWSGDISSIANPVTITMNGTKSVLAHFSPASFPLIVTVVGGGIVTRSPNQSNFDYGSLCRLTATPIVGYRFAGWGGDVTGVANPIDLLFDGPKAVSATFEVDPSVPPHIEAAADVPLDQGGRIKLVWKASQFDSPATAASDRVTSYWVWREIPGGAPESYAHLNAGSFRTTRTADREYRWEFVTSLPASYFPGYSYTAVTTNDSSAAGNPYTSFLVQGRTASGTVWWDSAPDSGYSVDNLAPAAPIPFTATYGSTFTALHWLPNQARDFQIFRLYRGSSLGFPLTFDHLLRETRDTSTVDVTADPFFYKLVAVDVHGNASIAAVVAPLHPVATLVSAIDVTAAADHIDLTWFVSSDPAFRASVYRRTESTDWAELGEVAPDGSGFLRYRDADVVAGERYTYRLGFWDGDTRVYAGDVWATARTPALSLAGVFPNPSVGGRVTLHFELLDGSPATLEIFDLAGRVVSQQQVGGLGAGPHAFDLGDGIARAPGVYLARLRQKGVTRQSRLVVVR